LPVMAAAGWTGSAINAHTANGKRYFFMALFLSCE